MSRLLLIQDEESCCDPLTDLLRSDGFQIALAETAPAGLAEFQANGADLVLLDLTLPGTSGIEVCRSLRGQSNVPIIMLTAKDNEIDNVLGLQEGADDCVTKPYSPPELLARVRAVLRRRPEPPDPLSPTLQAGPVRLNIERHTVTVDGRLITLPLKEFQLLTQLLRHPGRVLTRGQLIDRVWGSAYRGDPSTLVVHIKRLRAQIEPNPAQPVHILTVRGLGYKFEAEG